MKFIDNIKCMVLTLLLSVAAWPCISWGCDEFAHPDTYIPTWQDVYKVKTATTNSSYYDAFPYNKILPPELYKAITYDQEKMGALWAEVVGFRAPDVVGKIAPEIKPGHYTYKDLETKPGLKELLLPDLVENHIKPGGPPHSANIPEFEIIPTRQYYSALPVAEATKKNMGKTKLDDQGYLVTESWEPGYPFPRPEGKFMAQQYVYNNKLSYWMWGQDFEMYAATLGFTKDLKIDFDSIGAIGSARTSGRVFEKPFGFMDDRAATAKEDHIIFSFTAIPRDIAGMLTHEIYYLDAKTPDNNILYIPSIRRVRVLSTSDTQDPIQGQDITYDDGYGTSQKLSPDNFPWDYKVVEEREYLVPVAYFGNEHVDPNDGYALKNIAMERRPLVVIEMKQQDPNSSYVYSKRILYVDRESLRVVLALGYDQKGKLYRSYYPLCHFHPEFGTQTNDMSLYRDYRDLHSGVGVALCLPAFWCREDTGFKSLSNRAK
jgi:hypothetical protein